MTSGIKAQMGQAMSGMLKQAEENPAITSCALAAIGCVGITMAVSLMIGSLPVMALPLTAGVVMTGGLLLAGRHYVFKHFKDEEWVKKARKILRIALPVIFSAAFLAVAIGLTVHGIQVGSASSLGMEQIMPLFLGSGAGAMGLYAAGHLLSEGQENKKWYRALRSTAVVAGAIFMPLGYVGICALLMSGGPTTMLFYGGLIATGFLPDVLSESWHRLKPKYKEKKIETPRVTSPPVGMVTARYQGGVLLSGLRANRHQTMKELFPFGKREISPKDIKAFQEGDELKKEVEKAFKKAIAFYGLKWDKDQVVRTENFERKKKEWLFSGSPHYQDITRMLWFMREIGLGGASQKLYARLPSDDVDPRTRGAWRGASEAKDD